MPHSLCAVERCVAVTKCSWMCLVSLAYKVSLQPLHNTPCLLLHINLRATLFCHYTFNSEEQSLLVSQPSTGGNTNDWLCSGRTYTHQTIFLELRFMRVLFLVFFFMFLYIISFSLGQHYRLCCNGRIRLCGLIY